ncbi:Na(+)-translocating NADH-quinone reductase subunit A [Sagittula salina]|uniref:Na(+)-translocating NADH-quinone reductase subunit A n=1 Tax=Sagittula salina TaxID=2820268 RepID=A0A940MKK3_9RHOB|nr:Na(+)-translocating NADH-quinone reductase subunit A [Sagittula salina]MBP0483520.1 Na(+)-translocating NADH-quinone reductase subunit A [Sagittula salina]
MGFFTRGAGLAPRFGTPPECPTERAEMEFVTTEEAAVQAPEGSALPITPLVAPGDRVLRGQAVASLRHAPGISLVSPITGTAAHVRLHPGRKLSEIVIYREQDGDAGAVRHDTAAAADDATDLRRLMQASGVWPLLRRRPFGGMPAAEEVPAAIVVMATDTRPGAPDPRRALAGREEDLGRGLAALGRLTDGPVVLCLPEGAEELLPTGVMPRLRPVIRGALHPQGASGICIHQLCPAAPEAPVWDMHAEDAAALGALLKKGVLEMSRLVRIGGAGLREGRSLRTHPGADLRQLTRRIVAPGGHVLLSGSPLDGRRVSWLGPRDRQITVLPEVPRRPPAHWLADALGHAPRGTPVIPTAALTQAFGAALPAAVFVRALGAGDEETALRLGLLSLLEEDVALADYVLGEGGQVMAQLRRILDRVQRETAA